MEEKDIRGEEPSDTSCYDSASGIASEEVALKPKWKSWLENFWYHYKWHTIVSVFLLTVVTVITVQMCTRTTYDAYIVYAGNYEIKKSTPGASSPYSEALKSLGRVTEDFNGDGEKNVSFSNLFVVNEAEKDKLLEGTNNLEVNETLVREDTDTLESLIVYSDYYVFFLSERLFKEYEAIGEGVMFVPVDEFIDPELDYEYASQGRTGVYLRSLGFGELPTFCDMPHDTVVCLRYMNEFKKKQSADKYEESKTIFENILTYR